MVNIYGFNLESLAVQIVAVIVFAVCMIQLRKINRAEKREKADDESVR